MLTRKLALVAGLLTFVMACSDDSPAGSGQSGSDSDIAVTPIDGAGPADQGGGDTGDSGGGGGGGGEDDADGAGGGIGCGKGEFGDPCAQNTDCCSGICVETNEGAICTEECVETCVEGFVCKAVLNFYPDLVFACVPNISRLCQPCKEDFQCSGGRCVEYEDGKFCVTSCETEECPAGYTCEDVGREDGGTSKECRPQTGSCLCNAKTAGAVRGCQEANDIGACNGLETCDAELGWTGCDARVPAAEVCNGIDDDCDGIPDDGVVDGLPCEKSNEHGTCAGITTCLGLPGEVCSATEPAAETCNYKDDDCDGLTDEEFKEGDLYGTDDHCGACNTSCANAIPHAVAMCDPTEGPACVVKECTSGYFQVNKFLCLESKESICKPCQSDLSCGGGSCRELDGFKYCTVSCEDAECPGGFECLESGDGKWCVLPNGTCDCTTETAGNERTCSQINQFGTCKGVSTCVPEEGWVGCTAPAAAPEDCDGIDNDCDGQLDEDLPVGQACSITNEFGSCSGQQVCFGSAGWICQANVPVAELCNGKDDDCDGLLDEDFKNGAGAYDSYDHCGGCNVSCSIGFPNAKTVECSTVNPQPQCMVVECEPGYFKLNDFQCIPNTANLCEPCQTDASCLSQGAKCLPIGEGMYCGKICANDGDCPAGYTCLPDGDGGTQCQPTTGSCGCDGSNTSLSKSCDLTYTPGDPTKPEYTCFGIQKCTTQGWGPCELPLEACDAIDNDCDGVVDEGYLNGGKYDTAANCGVCGNNCTVLTFANASGVCNVDKAVPDCAMKCNPGFHDVNLNPNDGCECQYAGAVDLPDGIDQNCDGVDGEIDNAIFVAKNGIDTNPGTIEAPVLTIGAAIQKAKSGARRDVYVATGVYAQSLMLVAGVNVYGGFSATFGFRDTVLYETVIFGGAPTAGVPGAVNALDLVNPGGQTTTLDGFTVYGYDNKVPSESTYGIYVRNCDGSLRITNNHVIAGDGGGGVPGNKGTDGDGGAAGAAGKAAKDVGASCNAASNNTGGAGGTKSCGGSVNGGAGGTAICPDYDNNTSPPGCPDSNIGQSSAASELGQSGAGVGGGAGGGAGLDQYTDRGYGPYTNNICGLNSNANCSVCHLPPGNPDGSPGQNGAKGANGAKGTGGGSGGGQVSGGLWAVFSGAAGGTGAPGGGGGGGGAGGGVETFDCGATGAGGSDVGGSGGGGGSGACAGTGGQGGGGGGGSFALFFYYTAAPASTPNVQGNLVTTGNGGNGGNGGPAGLGGIGGNGGLGGANGSLVGNAVCAAAGGAGGRGGDGGHGGGGGGGAGGPSYGVYLSGANAAAFDILKSANLFDPAGKGGTGGFGGASLGTAGDKGTDGPSSVANF
ncbi:MAG: hypothetical protein AMXMBFR64_59780 [Myxococcales bacterium]